MGLLDDDRNWGVLATSGISLEVNSVGGISNVRIYLMRRIPSVEVAVEKSHACHDHILKYIQLIT